MRLADHNRGKTKSTARYFPWKVETYFAFASERKARLFEKYLKKGSGRAFRKRHF